VILEEGPESLEEKEARLRQELHEAKAEQAAGDTVTTMRVLQAQGKPDKVPLGPILTAWINFEGTDTKALIDTGSPVTIVSLEFAMEALAKQKKSDQTPDDWKKEVTARIQAPSAVLQGYGGGELHVVGQMECTLSRED
jgi:hypothetical protein